MVTEHEWRRRKKQVVRQPEWVGAQCVYSKAGWKRWKYSRRLQKCLLLAACCISSSFFLRIPLSDPIKEPVDITAWSARVIQAGKKGAFQLTIPEDMQLKPRIFTRQELIAGKMLMIDADHGLPYDLPPPNTFGIASYGNHSVFARSPKMKTGLETLEALEKLFGQLAAENIDGLCVYAGITTEEEQQDTRVAVTRTLMKQHIPAVSCATALQMTEKPGTGSRLLPYAVDIRWVDKQSGSAADQPMYATEEGKRFLDLAWRYGFVPEGQDQPFRFRYVGKVHATAMTYLNLGFNAYLSWLHEQGVIVINEGGRPAYLIVCRLYEGGDAIFELPECRSCEASIDNLGYALVACVL